MAKLERKLSTTAEQAKIAERVRNQKAERFPVEGWRKDIGRIGSTDHALAKHLIPLIQFQLELPTVELSTTIARPALGAQRITQTEILEKLTVDLVVYTGKAADQ